MDEVDLDVAFVHPFQEFPIKMVMQASGKFILDINWNSRITTQFKVKRYGNQIRNLKLRYEKTQQGFPWTVWTWGDLSPPYGGVQMQVDKVLMGGLMKGTLTLWGGT